MRNFMKRTVLLLALAALCVPASAQPPAKAPAKEAKRTQAPVAVPDTIKAEVDITYGRTPEQELKLDVYRPKTGGEKLPACVLVHGGGWIGGTKERFTALAIALAQKGYVVANIEYRLAPAAKYPAGVRDCLRAVRWVRANAARFGLDPQRIGAWGGSAGAHIVGLMAAAPTHANFLTEELKDVSAAVKASCIMAGPTDLAAEKFVEALRRAKEKSNSYQWFGKLYDDAPEIYKEASPITHFTKATGPILFLTGDLDNPERDAAGLAKLKELGVATKQVVLKDAKHGCWMQPAWSGQCVDAVDAWFQEHLK